MEELTITESALFLLFLSANFEWDTATNSIHGELPVDAEQLILKCITRLDFFEEVGYQDQLEEAIRKWNEFKSRSISTEDVIEQCAEILKKAPIKEKVYYLCNKIVFLKGEFPEDSKEENYMRMLEHHLNINPSVADIIFAIGDIESILNIE